MGLFMGLDIGTSGCKALVTDETGRFVSFAYRSYSVTYPRLGWMELDAEMVWIYMQECIAECCQNGIGKNIAAIAVSTQGEAIIPVSQDKKALAGAIVTFDTRNERELNQFESAVDIWSVQSTTGAPVHPMFSITKIMWYKNARPEIYEKAWKFLCFGDFISTKLGAAPCIDYTMAARTQAFDIHTLEWSNTILSAAGIDLSLLAEACPSGKAIGEIDKTLAETLGLNPGAIIVSGAHDQICCALGAGVIKSGIAMDSLGTTESILCIQDKAVISPGMIKNNIPCYPYALPGSYAYLSFLSCCGSVLDWYKNSILSDSTSFAEYDDFCKTISAPEGNPTGIYILPHFAGSGTPYLDFKSKGVICGLSLGTTRIELYMAIMEGACYEMAVNLHAMSDSNIDVNELRCIGGGAKSKLWMQLKADITGKPITVMKTNEAGCFGAAMMAAAGADAFKDMSEPARIWTQKAKIYYPNEKSSERYAEAFEKYKNIYEISRKTV